MATTRLMSIHAGHGRSISDVIDYVQNPEKTRNGELITSYECDSRTADAEFNLSKQQYLKLTGRSQGHKNVIAYHLRQSFLPGEIDAETANKIGYELAMKFTKGKHAFIVCTHIDKAHIHNHIIINSTTLDCERKFRNFLGSSFAIRKISDYLCVENSLSIIENPKRSKGKNYGDWLGTDKPLSYRSRLKDAIDAALAKEPPSFEAFLALLRDAGYTIDTSRKHITFLAPGQKKPTRLDTLKGEYTEASIRERISNWDSLSSESRTVQTQKEVPDLLIDIESKLQQGKGQGYAHWATVFNLKQAAKTLIYLQEHGIGSYGELKEKTSAVTKQFQSLSGRIKELDATLNANAELQKQIVTYIKTRQTYADYRKSGYSKRFKSEHEADILLHQTAKKYFDAHGFGRNNKLPTVKSLRTQYSSALEEKKAAYAKYRQAKAEMRELLVIQENVDRLLGTKEQETDRDMER